MCVVSVTLGSRTGTAALFSFTGPVITPGTLRLVGGAIGPTTLSVAASPTGLTVQFDGSTLVAAGTTVTYGPVTNPTMYVIRLEFDY